MMRNNTVKNLTLAAMFLGLGLVLPFLTGQIQGIGAMLSPMHIPVLLCGLICGWKYGLLVGVITLLLRSALFGMPVMFPGAIVMAFELGTYGAVVGYLYSVSKWHCLKAL
ncbi:ECF transporter S component [Ileibacterium valens]|uniref:ECF transporter S component n=1 Tax=Ileibacterium valens TaxID=1862668 RepID=UPI00272C6FB5|nr:ECF transporter S component [Ileibacterium valens]